MCSSWSYEKKLKIAENPTELSLPQWTSHVQVVEREIAPVDSKHAIRFPIDRRDGKVR